MLYLIYYCKYFFVLIVVKIRKINQNDLLNVDRYREASCKEFCAEALIADKDMARKEE